MNFLNNCKREFVDDLLTLLKRSKNVNDAYVYYDTPQGVVIHICCVDGIKSKFFEYPSELGTMS
jgi:hypothetical protein